MEIAIRILLIAVCAVFFAEVAPMPQVKFVFFEGLVAMRMKPFDCPVCMGWWIGIIFFLLSLPFSQWYMAPIYAACSSLLAALISKQTNQI